MVQVAVQLSVPRSAFANEAQVSVIACPSHCSSPASTTPSPQREACAVQVVLHAPYVPLSEPSSHASPGSTAPSPHVVQADASIVQVPEQASVPPSYPRPGQVAPSTSVVSQASPPLRTPSPQ